MTIGGKPTIRVTQEDTISALKYSCNEVRRNSSTSSPSKTNTRSRSGDRTGANSSGGSRKSSMTVLESNNGSSSKHFHTHQEENR